jgi:hypothetical protein
MIIMYHNTIVFCLLGCFLIDECSAFPFRCIRGEGGICLSRNLKDSTILFQNSMFTEDVLVRPSSFGIISSHTVTTPISSVVRPLSQKKSKIRLNLSPYDNNDPFGRKNDLLIPTILTSIGLMLFFFSPLGAIFFAITNSLFLLALITPLLLVGGLQIWTKFNVIQGECPSCGAPIAVMKEGRDFLSSTSPCFNCGAFVRATADNKGIELCNPPTVTEDLLSSDIIITAEDDDESLSRRAKRESTIIDVTVVEEDQQGGKNKWF